MPDGALESAKELVDQLNRYLLRAHAAGRRVVLIVDEAQNLSVEVLEQVRLLTNLETDSQKLLQIILIGQPELRELLGRNDLRQLAQRVTARFHLQPLAREETIAYVRHRLRVAGATSEIFGAALRRCIGSPTACRASSTSSATARCSGPTPRTATASPARSCATPRPRSSAAASRRSGCRGRSRPASPPRSRSARWACGTSSRGTPAPPPRQPPPRKIRPRRAPRPLHRLRPRRSRSC